MIVLFDTDVILDLLLDREAFAEAATLVFSRVEKGDITGYVCATTMTTLHYLAAKALGAAKARKYIQRLLSLLEVAPRDHAFDAADDDIAQPDVTKTGGISEMRAIVALATARATRGISPIVPSWSRSSAYAGTLPTFRS